jgi:cytochrome c oxidase subunit 3
VSQAIPLNSLAKQGKIVHDRPPMLAIGVMIWLGSELMFFSGLFAALFTIRAHLAAWPPVGTHLDVLQSGIFTIILVASSFTMQWAVWLIERRRRAEARNWIIVTRRTSGST